MMAKNKGVLEILYEDTDYWVLNKQSGIASIDEHAYSGPSLLKHVRQLDANASLCHRLDKETSGCIIASKHPDAYKHVALQFQNREITKIYHALVCGSHQFEQHEVNLPLFTGSKRVKISKNKGKNAQTFFKTLETFKHYSLIECQPITGRLHQIRVHLYALKASIVNDRLYNGCTPYLSELKPRFKLTDMEETPIISRLALHAQQISFNNIEGKRITVAAPMPKELNAFLKILRKYDTNHQGLTRI